MKLKLTSAQIQSFIFALDCEDCPFLLADFYNTYSGRVFDEPKKYWTIGLNYTAKKWLIGMLKARNKTLLEMAKENEEDNPRQTEVEIYWWNEAKANRESIVLAKRVIAKLKKVTVKDFI